MKSQLLYIMITLCIFVGIGAVIKGLTKISGRGTRIGESRKSRDASAVTTGIMLISIGLLLLYLFSDLLTDW